MGNVWFTSDLHLGHVNCAQRRGFPEAIEHDNRIYEEWLSHVRRDDQVWVLGDLAASSPTYALETLARLPGHKHLIAGNHDKCHPMHRDAHKFQPRYLDVFESVQTFARCKVAGQKVLLSHFPYHVDHTDEPRHMQYRLRDLREFLLHGHTHSKQRYTSLRELHIGVDAWDYAPVPIEEIQLWVRNQADAMTLGYPELAFDSTFAVRQIAAA